MYEIYSCFSKFIECNLDVSNLRSEMEGSRFESGHWLLTEVSFIIITISALFEIGKLT